MNPNALSLEDLNALLALLQERYPAFRDCLPLALDTRQRAAELATATGAEPPDVQLALRLWTGRPRYLRALAAPGAVRYTLEGEPGDPVTKNHADFARVRLKSRKPKKPRPEPAPVVSDNPPAPVVTAAALGKPLLTLKRKAAA